MLWTGVAPGGAGRAAGLPVVGVLAIVAVGYFLGIDVTPLLQDGAIGGGQGNGQPVELTEADKRAGEFVSVTLADTEEVWTDVFRQQVDGQYVEPKLVLFKGATQSACGGASGRVGAVLLPGGQPDLPRHGFLHDDGEAPWCEGRLRSRLCRSP